MKKTDSPYVITIKGDNNKIFLGGKSILPITIVVLIIAMVVLAISLCCPELLADCVRWVISIALNS